MNRDSLSLAPRDPIGSSPPLGQAGQRSPLRMESGKAMTRESRARAFVFADPASLFLAEQIERFAPSDATILIVGETGTGKELVARQAHALSRRSKGPFAAVNCAALPEALVESELFGHERGSFTNAIEGKPGWFETADRGTLFLDEIGDLPLSAQGALLRVLQEREVVRVGARQGRAVDFRLIAATNVNLEAAVAAGRFRSDLYYRVKVATLVVAPLRERPLDIAPLAEHFLHLHGAREPGSAPTLSADALALLRCHPWPGNIRELENAIHRAVLVRRGTEIGATDFELASPLAIGANAPPMQHAELPLEAALSSVLAAGLPKAFDHVVDSLVRLAYEHAGRNQVHAAELLGISRNVLRSHLARLGLIRGRASPRERA